MKANCSYSAANACRFIPNQSITNQSITYAQSNHDRRSDAPKKKNPVSRMISSTSNTLKISNVIGVMCLCQSGVADAVIYQCPKSPLSRRNTMSTRAYMCGYTSMNRQCCEVLVNVMSVMCLVLVCWHACVKHVCVPVVCAIVVCQCLHSVV